MDEREIRRISARSGLGHKFISKEGRVTEILNWISRIEDLDLILKGGTAINRIHSGPDFRFSEDIDLDMVGKMTLDEKISMLKKEFEDIENFDVKGPRMLHLTGRFDLFYENEFGEKDRVRVDVYLPNKEVQSAVEPKREILQSMIIPGNACMINTYSLEDLFSQKLMALQGRIEGKDVYDLSTLLKKEIDGDLLLSAISKRLALRNDKRPHVEFLKDLENRREVFLSDWTMIMNTTNHYIPRDRRPQWRGIINSVFDGILMMLEGYRKNV